MLAANDVAGFLADGTLQLFLGAGVSKGFGLPGWHRLVAGILGKADDVAFVDSLKPKSDKDLGKLIDPIDDGTIEYQKKVHAALYPSSVANDLSEQLQRSPLLLAVAGLLTGSCRGRIDRIITYNYDDLLEQYLRMLGYSVCIRTDPIEFSSRADVEINHNNGFLPQAWDKTTLLPEVVLSEKSFRERRSEIDKGWSSYVEHCLDTKNCLFLGLSGDDSAMLDVLKRAHNRIQRRGDYIGYWLMTPDAFLRNSASLLHVGVCPIQIPKEKLPGFIFDVCQIAAKKSS